MGYEKKLERSIELQSFVYFDSHPLRIQLKSTKKIICIYVRVTNNNWNGYSNISIINYQL